MRNILSHRTAKSRQSPIVYGIVFLSFALTSTAFAQVPKENALKENSKENSVPTEVKNSADQVLKDTIDEEGEEVNRSSSEAGDQEKEKKTLKAQPTNEDKLSKKKLVKPVRNVIRANKRIRNKRLKKKLKGKKRIRRFPTNRPKRKLKDPPTLGKIPFSLGEELTFKVNMLNAHSGTVTLKVGRRGQLKGKSVLELSGFVQSSPVLENFYRIRDSLRVLVDEKTFQPVKSEFFLNEKNRKVEYISDFNQETGVLDWKKTREVKGKQRISNLSYIAPTPMYETLSSLYALRRLDLKVGLEFEQYIWDGQRERLIKVKVVSEERVLTGIGWVEAFKLEINGAVTGGIISKKTLKRPPVKGLAWIAKDAYRTPIKAITPTKLGQAEAVLSAKKIVRGQ